MAEDTKTKPADKADDKATKDSASDSKWEGLSDYEKANLRGGEPRDKKYPVT